MTDQELRISAAEKVMGWTPRPLCSNPGSAGYFPNAVEYGPRECGLIAWNDDVHEDQLEGFDPLGSDADAFMLVDELMAQGWYLKLGGPSPWVARFWHSTGPIGMFDAVDHARRRAIVMACLKAKGVEC
ncbi:MAG TPA: hypothetical protein VLH09_07060 [Bryobacteraceae bacterium]|nr:hypothetical protein [Bryobacteraceae bacterium]